MIIYASSWIKNERIFSCVLPVRVTERKKWLVSEWLLFFPSLMIEIINLSEYIFFIKLYSYFESDDHVIFVMEYLCGGDLMTHIHQDTFSEQCSCFYAACVALDLEFLHTNKIIYRNLKLDNLLLNRQGYFKIVE